jgi:hypothetical protein
MTDGHEPHRLVPRTLSERREAIAKEAYFLAEQRPGRAPEKNWYEAEADFDFWLFQQPLTLRDRYRSLALKFFGRFDDVSRVASAGLGREFCKLAQDWTWLLPSGKQAATDRTPTHAALLSPWDEPAEVARRALLLSGPVLLCHTGSELHEYKSHSVYHDPVYDYAKTTSDSTSVEPGALGDWLKEGRGLLEAGEVLYWPKTSRRQRIDSQASGYLDEGIEQVFDPAWGAILQDGGCIQLGPRRIPTGKRIHVAAELEVPFLETADLDDLARVCADEAPALGALRDLVRDGLGQIDATLGSELLGRDLAVAGMRLRDGMRALTSDLRALCAKRAPQEAQARVATTPAILAVVDVRGLTEPERSDFLGRLGAFGRVLMQNRKKLGELEKRPFYRLWMLKRP